MSCLLCLFKCISCCGCRDYILNKYAFHPPDPSYLFQEIQNETSLTNKSFVQNESLTKEEKIKRNNELNNSKIFEKKKQLSTYKIQIKDKNDKFTDIPDFPELKVTGYKVSTGKKDQRYIPNLFILNKRHPSDYLIIFSHGNSTDLGFMLDSYLDLSYNCRINVLAYDYSGYGLNKQKKKKLNDLQIIEDIIAQYLFARNQLKFEWNKIILYGQSLGTGPSTYLASHSEYPIAGLILHSAYSSGLRIMVDDMQETYKKDFFPNIDLLQYVNAPVLFMHGTEDEEIPYKHCEENSENTKRKMIWKVEKAGHNNIETDKRFRKEYFFKLREFIQFIKDQNQSKTVGQIFKMNKANPWDQDFNHIYKDKFGILKSFSFSSKQTMSDTNSFSNRTSKQSVRESKLSSQYSQSSSYQKNSYQQQLSNNLRESLLEKEERKISMQKQSQISQQQLSHDQSTIQNQSLGQNSQENINEIIQTPTKVEQQQNEQYNNNNNLQQND